MGQKTARCKGLYEPSGEVQTCRILANRAIIGRILHTNRNGGFYGVFPQGRADPGRNRSPNRAYFTHSQHMHYWGILPSFFIVMKSLISDKKSLSCMDLFVLRHGKAGQSTDGTDDSKRALTGDGKDEIRKTGKWMRQKKFGFDVIATSPLTRAYETAEIIARALGRKERLIVWEELAPGGDLDTICYHAAQYGEDAAVLLTGHEPLLSMLISRIIAGNDTISIILAKGGLAKIRNFSFDKRPSGDLQWLLTPAQMMEMR